MPFVTTPERYGRMEGMLMIIEGRLRTKFGEEGVKLLPEIKALHDADKFRMVGIGIATATTVEEVRAAYAAAAPQPKKSARKKRA